MNAPALLHLRLANHRLLAPDGLKRPEDVVAWLGAMQAQLPEMAKWGIGARLPGSTVHDINRALDAGRIVRTHILRPTWHFVAAKDIHWLSALSRPSLLRDYTSYCKRLGIDEADIRKGLRLIEKSLADGQHYTADELRWQMVRRGLRKSTHELNIIIHRAEIDGLVCSGRQQGAKQTIALLQYRVPLQKQPPTREEAVVRLLQRYLSSHAPAALEDFVWWSGLNLTEARRALEELKPQLLCEKINGRELWFAPHAHAPEPSDASIAHLLPAFDEAVVSYKNRAEIIDKQQSTAVITVNGMFSPTVMLNGKTIGTWRKASDKNKGGIGMNFFTKPSRTLRALCEAEAARVAAFFA